MHHCAFCRSPLRPLSEWRGNDGRFYCGEFCADAGEQIESLGRSSVQRRSQRGRMMARSS